MAAEDYAHIIIACLTHDIGYVRGLFREDSVAPHVQTAIRYLNVTCNGRQWIANLYSSVFRAERNILPLRAAEMMLAAKYFYPPQVIGARHDFMSAHLIQPRCNLR
jgi:hypothetical protein